MGAPASVQHTLRTDPGLSQQALSIIWIGLCLSIAYIIWTKTKLYTSCIYNSFLKEIVGNQYF